MSAKVFFDPDRARGPTDQPDVAAGRDARTLDVTAEFVGREGGAPMTVSALLAAIKTALAERLPRDVVVIGEISNFKRHGSGHLYFSLKDANGQIPAAMFRASAEKLRFEPTDGLEVVAEGRVDVYEPQGKLQIYVTRLTPRGAGALELAFRQLVAKLEAEGLFDSAHKAPLPPYPATICVITSSTGAAIRDIRRTLARRWPAGTVYLIPVRVQGGEAAEEIAQALRQADANAERLGLDVIILARGGGSIEDLWCFNEEAVARAIFNCQAPVVTGIGHEVDTTIADMVADVRAATPTAAAELATPDREQLVRLLGQLGARLGRNVTDRCARGLAALRLVQRSEFFRNPLHRVRTLTQRLDESAGALRSNLRQRHAQAAACVQELQAALRWRLGGLANRKAEALAERRARFAAANPIQQVRLGRRGLDAQARQLLTVTRAALAGGVARIDRCHRTLEALNYRNVLQRGYSVTRDLKGQILRCVVQTAPGQTIRTELSDGEVRSVVDGPPTKKTRKPPADAGPTLF